MAATAWARNSSAVLPSRSSAKAPVSADSAAKAAVACMRTAMDEPSEFMPFLDPYLAFYDPIREEPAFVELLAELENETRGQ